MLDDLTNSKQIDPNPQPPFNKPESLPNPTPEPPIANSPIPPSPLEPPPSNPPQKP